MPNSRQGSIHLFRIAGVDLFLHWSWFVVAAYEIQSKGRYSSITWHILEYLALFLIVLMHEFGHAMACRSVGGTADQIMLWPLGGVAYVDPPQRPGATLWSIAAGPLVNVALLPVLYAIVMFGKSAGWAMTMPNVYLLARAVLFIDASSADLQYAARLSTGWRTDSSFAVVVCAGARSKPDGGDYSRLRGDRGRGRAGCVPALGVARHSLCFHADELLERAATGASVIACGEVAATEWVCLSELPDCAATGRFLGMLAMRAEVRHVSDRSSLPELLGSVCGDGMS